MVDIKDLYPALMRLLPSFGEQYRVLSALCASLQKEVRAAIGKHGPQLGALYFDKDYSWDQVVASFKSLPSSLQLSLSVQF